MSKILYMSILLKICYCTRLYLVSVKSSTYDKHVSLCGTPSLHDFGKCFQKAGFLDSGEGEQTSAISIRPVFGFSQTASRIWQELASLMCRTSRLTTRLLQVPAASRTRVLAVVTPFAVSIELQRLQEAPEVIFLFKERQWIVGILTGPYSCGSHLLESTCFAVYEINAVRIVKIRKGTQIYFSLSDIPSDWLRWALVEPLKAPWNTKPVVGLKDIELSCSKTPTRSDVYNACGSTAPRGY